MFIVALLQMFIVVPLLLQSKNITNVHKLLKGLKISYTHIMEQLDLKKKNYLDM